MNAEMSNLAYKIKCCLEIHLSYFVIIITMIIKNVPLSITVVIIVVYIVLTAVVVVVTTQSLLSFPNHHHRFIIIVNIFIIILLYRYIDVQNTL